jgi:predicted aspartyl protease
MSDESLILRVDGPIVDAELADPKYPQGTVARVQMLIDTGAELSVVPRDVIDALGLPRTREIEIAGVVPRAFARCPVFRVVLHVGGGAFDVEVAALDRDEVSVAPQVRAGPARSARSSGHSSMTDETVRQLARPCGYDRRQ